MADEPKIEITHVPARSHVKNESEEYWGYHCPHCARAGMTFAIDTPTTCGWCKGTFVVTEGQA